MHILTLFQKQFHNDHLRVGINSIRAIQIAHIS